MQTLKKNKKDRQRQPERSCIVCHGKHVKKDMVRYVWKGSGLFADDGQVMPGRGGYCCNRETCLSQVALSEKRLKRAFRLISESSQVKKLQTGTNFFGTDCG